MLWTGTLALGCLLLVLPFSSQGQGCAAMMEYQPTLVENSDHRVTYVCHDATRLEVIQGVGRQTRLPIGLVLGRETRALLWERQTYSLRDVDARTAMRTVLQGTGYTLQEKDGVLLVMAGDLSRRQRRLLQHRYVDFKTNPGASLSDMGQYLTMWMRIAAGARMGFVLGGISSPNEEGFTLPPLPAASTEEIANRIVGLGPHGLWVFNASPRRTRGEPTDRVEIESYQHYSNRPDSCDST